MVSDLEDGEQVFKCVYVSMTSHDNWRNGRGVMEVMGQPDRLKTGPIFSVMVRVWMYACQQD